MSNNQALPRRVSTLPNRSRERSAALKIEAHERRRCCTVRSAGIPRMPFLAGAMRLCGVAAGRVAGLDRLPTGRRLLSLSSARFCLKFFGQSDWNPVSDQYGALPFMYGTIVSSLLSLVIAVPLAIGVAVFITEMSPGRPAPECFPFTTELLAAIPSVVYGLWAILPSFWCRYFANMCSHSWARRWAGRGFSPGLPTASACWQRA